MLEKIMKAAGVAGPEVIVDLIYKPNNQFRFIDLRSAPEYLKGHLPDAINIPINHIFDKEYASGGMLGESFLSNTGAFTGNEAPSMLMMPGAPRAGWIGFPLECRGR